MTKFIDVSGDTKKERKKETVFTHCQKFSGEFVSGSNYQPKDYEEVYYLGKFTSIGKLFKAVDQDGDSFLYKGIKGDEF